MMRGENRKNIGEIGKRYPVTCSECGTVKMVVRSRIVRTKTCSRKCANIRQKRIGWGDRNNAWKDGRRLRTDGYIEVRTAKGGGRPYTLEHRIVMEASIGRQMNADEDVHHINEIKDDNRIENLCLMKKGEHARLHGRKNR